jgi:4-amino-4-deoxy-L-arabinose transferase-like glycosyltransferase
VSRQQTSRQAIWLVMAVGFTAALSVVVFQMVRRGATGIDDPYHYGEIARGLLAHGFDKVTRRSAMLYPHMLAAIYWIGGSDRVVLLIHCCFHAATCGLVYAIGQRLFNRRAAFIAGIAIALHPMLLRYIPDLHTEALLVLATTATVWSTIRFHDRPSFANAVVVGLIGILGTLTKGVVLPVVLAFIVVWFAKVTMRDGVTLRHIASVLVILVTMATVLAPWTYRNYRVSGRFVLLTPGTADAFLRGYVFTRPEFATLRRPPYTDAENEVNAWFRRIARDAGTQWEADEIVDEDNNKRVAHEMIRTHPIDTLRKSVVGLFTFWYEMTSLTNSLVPAVLAVLGWVLAVIGIRFWRGTRPVWLILQPIVVMNVFVALLIPLGRYSVPILPCLAVLAGAGCDAWLRSRDRPTAIEVSAQILPEC